MDACLNLLPQSGHSCVGGGGDAIVVDAVVVLGALLGSSAILTSDNIFARSEMERSGV